MTSYFKTAKGEERHGKNARVGKRCDVFSFFLSYYADDSAFVLMNRRDAEIAAALVVRHFRKFGLTIHVGNRQNDTKSKTEALYVPSMWRHFKKYEDIPHRQKKLLTLTSLAEIMSAAPTFTSPLHSSTLEPSLVGTYENPSMFRPVSIPPINSLAQLKAPFGGMQASRLSSGCDTTCIRQSSSMFLIWGCESWAIKVKEVRALILSKDSFQPTILMLGEIETCELVVLIPCDLQIFFMFI